MDQPLKLLCDIPASFTFQQLLLCLFSRLKELFKVKNGLTVSFLFFLLKMPKMWVDRMTLNREKKRGLPLIAECFSFKYDRKNQCVNQDCSIKKKRLFV